MRWLRTLTLIATLVLGACAEPAPEPVAIPVLTQQPPDPGAPFACMDALLVGTLVTDPRWGIAVAGEGGGRVVKVYWPSGYVGREADGVIELLDRTGRVVGRVGDHVELGGGLGIEDAWYTCGL